MKKNNTFLFILIGLIVFGTIYLVVSLTQNVGKTSTTINMEKSIRSLNTLYKDINVKTSSLSRSNSITSNEEATILPDISEYPFVVNPTTDAFITVYSSTEKANENENAWLCQIANRFNKANIKINEVPISVGIRAIPSQLASEFITTEKYTPDLYMPSSSIYGRILDNYEKKYVEVSKSVLNNVSGIVITKKAKDSINSKYSNTNIETVINSVINGETIIGYTNPLSNEDGLNYLLTLLNTFDNSSPLSENAINKLKTYQDKIPYVPYDIAQLEESLQNGTIDGFASNYQTYYNIPALRNNFEFIPYGINQNQPAYALGELTNIKKEIILKFIEYCTNDESKKMANNCGFNAIDYTYSGHNFVGTEIIDAQNMWKKQKNGSNDLTAVFVSDVSGSMEGSPLLKLKASLNRAASFIDENTNIGLVTFSDTVNIALPIAKFDSTQKSYFVNSVKSMKAAGGTAMFDAIVVAEHMLIEAQQKNPNTRLMLFVLTDGESNRG